MTDDLLALQDLDTQRDQLRHRLEHLAELEAVKAAHGAMVEWERTRNRLVARLAELDAAIRGHESESADIDVTRARLEAQLRTVIAVREAEALQHEIAALVERRAGLDDAELQALEEQSTIDDELTRLGTEEADLRQAVQLADQRLVEARGDLDGELTALDGRCEALRDGIDARWLGRYDRLRDQLGIAVVRLVGNECVGCPFTLTAGEVDIVRSSPTDEPADCPQCGRLIVH